jgi:hypothetical protein
MRFVYWILTRGSLRRNGDLPRLSCMWIKSLRTRNDRLRGGDLFTTVNRSNNNVVHCITLCVYFHIVGSVPTPVLGKAKLPDSARSTKFHLRPASFAKTTVSARPRREVTSLRSRNCCVCHVAWSTQQDWVTSYSRQTEWFH